VPLLPAARESIGTARPAGCRRLKNAGVPLGPFGGPFGWPWTAPPPRPSPGSWAGRPTVRVAGAGAAALPRSLAVEGLVALHLGAVATSVAGQPPSVGGFCPCQRPLPPAVASGSGVPAVMQYTTGCGRCSRHRPLEAGLACLPLAPPGGLLPAACGDRRPDGFRRLARGSRSSPGMEGVRSACAGSSTKEIALRAVRPPGSPPFRAGWPGWPGSRRCPRLSARCRGHRAR